MVVKYGQYKKWKKNKRNVSYKMQNNVIRILICAQTQGKYNYDIEYMLPYRDTRIKISSFCDQVPIFLSPSAPSPLQHVGQCWTIDENMVSRIHVIQTQRIYVRTKRQKNDHFNSKSIKSKYSEYFEPNKKINVQKLVFPRTFRSHQTCQKSRLFLLSVGRVCIQSTRSFGDFFNKCISL